MASSSADADYCAELLHQGDLDHWLSTLFAPEEHRAAIRSLYAFDLELRRVAMAVSVPQAGEIRLQWWRGVAEGDAPDGGGSPVAAELLRSIIRYRLPRAALLALVDARTQDLYDDPPPTLRDLEGYFGETRGALLRLSALILADGGDAGSPDGAGHGGVAEGCAALVARLWQGAPAWRQVPADLLGRHGLELNAQGTYEGPEPTGLLAELRAIALDHDRLAREAVLRSPRAVRAAFLPLALVKPLLGRPRRWVRGAASDVPQWRRQWAMWLMSRRW
jgi:15-cis-phytoene synthase